MAITRSQTKSGYAKLAKPDSRGRRGKKDQGWFSSSKLNSAFATVIVAGLIYACVHFQCILEFTKKLTGDLISFINGEESTQADSDGKEPCSTM